MLTVILFTHLLAYLLYFTQLKEAGHCTETFGAFVVVGYIEVTASGEQVLYAPPSDTTQSWKQKL